MWYNGNFNNKSNTSRVWRRVLVFSIAGLLSATFAAAQERTNEGVRSAGMGGAYMGISDDVNGISFNPSGTIYSPQRFIIESSVENLFSSGSPFKSGLENDGRITFSSIGFILNYKPNRTIPVLVMAGGKENPPLNNGPTSNMFSLGAMANYLNAGFLNQLALRAFASKGFFQKNNLRHSDQRWHVLALSVTGKLWRYDYDNDIADLAQVNSEAEREAIRSFFAQNGDSKIGLGLDFGASLKPWSRARIGLAFINAISPNLGLAANSQFRRSIRGGVAVLLKPGWQWLVAADVEVNSDVKVKKQVEQVKPDTLKFFIGSEITVKVPRLQKETLKFRAGANRNWASVGFQFGKPFDGISFNINYALLFFLHDGGLNNHRFSLSFSGFP